MLKSFYAKASKTKSLIFQTFRHVLNIIVAGSPNKVKLSTYLNAFWIKTTPLKKN